jgi:hypothetical protein
MLPMTEVCRTKRWTGARGGSPTGEMNLYTTTRICGGALRWVRLLAVEALEIGDALTRSKTATSATYDV